LVYITEMKSVYSAVRTGALNKAVCASSVINNIPTIYIKGNTVVKVLGYKPEFRQFDPSWCHCNFSLT